MDTHTLLLNAQERAYLGGLVQTDLEETRVELRRTKKLSLHDELHQREVMIRGLLEKIQAPTTTADARSGS